MVNSQITTKPGILALLKESAALWVIAWPMLIAQLAQMGTGVVDTVMAGHYNAVDLAAIAIGYNVWLPLYLLFVGVMLGATAIVAQDFGAGNVREVRCFRIWQTGQHQEMSRSVRLSFWTGDGWHVDGEHHGLGGKPIYPLFSAVKKMFSVLKDDYKSK